MAAIVYLIFLFFCLFLDFVSTYLSQNITLSVSPALSGVSKPDTSVTIFTSEG